MYKMHEKTHEKTSNWYNKSENMDVFQNMYKMHVLLMLNYMFPINLPYSIVDVPKIPRSALRSEKLFPVNEMKDELPNSN